MEKQNGSLSDGSQNESGSSEGLDDGSYEARDEYFFYGANEPGKDESSMSMLQELMNDKTDKNPNTQKPAAALLPVQSQGPIKARRIGEPLAKETKTSAQSPAAKQLVRAALTEESKKQALLAQEASKYAETEVHQTEPFLSSEDLGDPQELQKKRGEPRLKRINSKESLGSKKSTTSKRSKANSKRGTATGAPKMTFFSDLMKRIDSRPINSVPSLQQLDSDRHTRAQGSNSSAMPQMFSNMITQNGLNLSCLKQKTEHHSNKDHPNLLLSDRRSPQKALKQNLVLGPEALTKTAQSNPAEELAWQSTTSKTKNVPIDLAKIFPRAVVEEDAALTKSQINTVSHEPQMSLNSTLFRSKIFCTEKKLWFNSKEKSVSDTKKASSIFDSILMKTERKDRASQEESEARPATSQLLQSCITDRKQPSGLQHLIEELKTKPGKQKQDKEEKDGKARAKKQTDNAQKLSSLALYLQSAVQN
jgi:hypothetical protein